MARLHAGAHTSAKALRRFNPTAANTGSNRTSLVGYATVRPAEWVGIGAQIGWLRPSILPRAGWFEGDRPDTRDVFPGESGLPPRRSTDLPAPRSVGHRRYARLSRPPDARRRVSRRRGQLHRSRRACSASGDTKPRRRTSSRSPARVSSSRCTDGWSPPIPTRGRSCRSICSQASAAQNTLRGYADYRFHDRNLARLNAETRVAMMTHVDAAVFVDAGQCRAALRRSESRQAVVRRRASAAFAAADLCACRRRARRRRMAVLFRLTDPLNLSRLSRRTAAVPFVP